MQKKKEIISRYDQTAEKYDKRYFSIQNLKFHLLFEKITEYNTDLVLDLGVGTGLLFDLLKSRSNSFVGIDISKNMLRVALRNKKSNNLHLICADAEFLPFKKNVFTSIFSITVLQNLPNPINSINEVIRVCKKGGIAVLTVLKKGLELGQFDNMFSNEFEKILSFEMKNAEDLVTIRKKNSS